MSPCGRQPDSSVAQWQSIRLLTGGLLVRVQPEEPITNRVTLDVTIRLRRHPTPSGVYEQSNMEMVSSHASNSDAGGRRVNQTVRAADDASAAMSARSANIYDGKVCSISDRRHPASEQRMFVATNEPLSVWSRVDKPGQ
jgi:hypothetical protein